MTQRLTNLRMTLTGVEQARYFKAKDWYRSNVDKQVPSEAEVYIIERVLSKRPIKGSQLLALAGKSPAPVPVGETRDLFDEEEL